MSCMFCNGRGIVFLTEKKKSNLYFQGKSMEFHYGNYAHICFCPAKEKLKTIIEKEETIQGHKTIRKFEQFPDFPKFSRELMETYDLQK